MHDRVSFQVGSQTVVYAYASEVEERQSLGRRETQSIMLIQSDLRKACGIYQSWIDAFFLRQCLVNAVTGKVDFSYILITMKTDTALIVSILSLAVSTEDFLVSRARSKRLEDRETAIESRESQLEKTVEALGR